jgi:hypothetical protein
VSILLLVLLEMLKNQFTWVFASVYGPNCDCDRRFLWDELFGLVNC